MRLEVLDNLTGLALALPHHIQHLHILQQVLAVEALNGQAYDVIARLRHALHLHASQGTYEDDRCIRTQLTDGIGYGYSGKDVASGATSADDDS